MTGGLMAVRLTATCLEDLVPLSQGKLEGNRLMLVVSRSLSPLNRGRDTGRLTASPEGTGNVVYRYGKIRGRSKGKFREGVWKIIEKRW